VDLLYLHNPGEAQLAQIGPEAFMQRLHAAFEFCEQARAAGKIKAYGLATWSSFRVAPGHRNYLALQSIADLAEEVGGQDHGFGCTFSCLGWLVLTKTCLCMRPQRALAHMRATRGRVELLQRA
jgi:hypothetical protein